MKMDPMVVASAIVLIIGSLTTGIIAIINSFSKMRFTLKTLDLRTDEIKKLVNGSTAKLHEEIRGLHGVSFSDRRNTS